MLVSVKVRVPLLKDLTKPKGREKGGRYKVLIVPAMFPSRVLSFYHS